jgi:hypothetical protein
MMITMAQVEAWRPCEDWPRERLLEYAAGREQIPLLTILRDEGLGIYDRVWLGCNALPEILWWCADRAVRLHAPRALDAADLRELAQTLRSLEPVTDKRTASLAGEAVDTVWEATRDAQWDRRGAAASCAVQALAAVMAAGDAAQAVGADAAWAAAGAAGRAEWAWDLYATCAAHDAEYRAQLQRLIEMAEERAQ